MDDGIAPSALLLIVSLLAAPAAAAAGMARPALAPSTAIAGSALAFAAALWGTITGGDLIDLPWAPTWGLRLTFRLDGLAGLYALLATGIGVVVLVYASRYLPLHLEHQGRPARDGVRFYGLVLLFMGSMVGLVMAQDLLLIFLFWDLTAVASYFLIGFDRQEPAARFAAMMALFVTGVSAICLLIAAVLLGGAADGFGLATVFARVGPGGTATTAAALVAVAALAKSAQVPLHFWLPRAMAAPTPVSAYLHSAAMVAAGVFLLARFHPLIVRAGWVGDALVVVGFLSMAVGGALALVKDELKPLLAYSTVAQYGYVVVMLGLGGTYGLAGAAFYVVAHALAKSALFLAAGAVTEATGERELGRLGGLWRRLPALAVGSGAAAAALAALPLTVGFFKDELFFAAALERGPLVAALATFGAAMTVGYAWRFWAGVFLGAPRGKVGRVPAALVWPVVLLGALAVVGGIVVEPVTWLAKGAGAVSAGEPTPIAPAYHLDARAENLMALAAYVAGVVIVVTRPVWHGAVAALAQAGERLGPECFYCAVLDRLHAFSDAIHRIEVRDLRSRVATILVPAGVLIMLGQFATPSREAFAVGTIDRSDLSLVLMVVVTAAAALATTVPRDHLSLALVLSGVGFSLAVVYAFLGAPNVALVAVLVETLFALLFLGMLAAMPAHLRRQVTDRADPRGRRRRDPVLGVIAGLIAFVVVWGVLSRPIALESAATKQTELTPAAHAGDVVTAILADFRGLDTMGEITVIAVALLGLTTLLGRRRAT